MSSASTTPAQRLEAVRTAIAEACQRADREADEVRLIAVTKYGSASLIAALQAASQRDFAENRVQQLVPRAEASHRTARDQSLPTPRWHMIGRLQRNKVKHVAGVIDWLHSLDDERLIDDIERRREPLGKPQPIMGLVQVNIAGESQKGGVEPTEVEPLLVRAAEATQLRIVGLMTMAPYADDASQVRGLSEPVFAKLRELRDSLVDQGWSLPELSMGMTADYAIAIEHGTTMVRVGSALVGEDGAA